jgi:ATP-dependent helicase/nuclease subunit B
VQVFLRVEANSSNRRPVFLETTIGMPSFLGGTELDGLEPVSIELPRGKTIKLRGRIDRIDRIESGSHQEYSICDYKSASAGRFEHHDPFNQGRVLQHALYLIMGATTLKKKVSSEATVSEFSYFFPGIRDQGLRLIYRAGELSECGRIIENLCDITATGSFLATDNPDTDCAFCDYLGICGDVQSLGRWSRKKMDNYDNVLLRPMRELRARE